MKLINTLLSIITITTVYSSPIDSGGSFVSTTESFRKDDIKNVHTFNEKSRNDFAWRGERLNWQILLWAAKTPVKTKVSATDLTTSAGDKISANQIKLDFLKFINMNTRDGYLKDPSHNIQVPDMLNGSAPITIEPGQIQPLWIAVNIPKAANPGLYKGNILVQMNSKTQKFPFSIQVLETVVPDVKDWTFDVNLWTHPQATLHYYKGCQCHGTDEEKRKHNNCKELMWSDQHLAWYKPTLELLRDTGVRTITVNLVKDPWRTTCSGLKEQTQTNYSYDEMIQWRRNKDGRFLFDFTHFEKYVKFCMDLGIDKRIDCFSMLPWLISRHSGVTCFDETTEKEIIYYFKSWDEYATIWHTFLEEFVPILIKNGWFEKTRIGVDERGLGNIPHVIKLLNQFKHNGKTLKLSAAANRTHSFDDALELISMHGGTSRLANEKWSDDQFLTWADSRRKKGLKSTWYTCTGTYPGNFGNSRPAESTFIGWYSAKIGAEGYLRWSVDSWNDNPTETTDHKLFETGDTFQVYPGNRNAKVPFTRSSVRFELFRQGIVDYEKIRILKQKYPETKKAIETLLATIERPKMPARIKGNSSLTYENSTENDFSAMIEFARNSLLNITLNALNPTTSDYQIEYLPNSFALQQNHQLKGFVVQDSVVHLPVGPDYKLVSGSGYILANRFYANHYGMNVIEGSDGKVHKIFCHFSSKKIAGGDERRLKGLKLDRIQDFANLMRFQPGVGKTDPKSAMVNGPHTTVEPRLFVDSRGIFYCAYHVKDHTYRSDAATGMGIVVSVSKDQGNSWKDVWYENHHNGVLGYPSFCEYNDTVHMYFNGSHTHNRSKRHWQGVQRITTKDGINWTKMERIDGLNKLLTGKEDGTPYCLTHNALTVPDMTWKGKKGTAILMPHYNASLQFL